MPVTVAMQVQKETHGGGMTLLSGFDCAISLRTSPSHGSCDFVRGLTFAGLNIASLLKRARARSKVESLLRGAVRPWLSLEIVSRGDMSWSKRAT